MESIVVARLDLGGFGLASFIGLGEIGDLGLEFFLVAVGDSFDFVFGGEAAVEVGLDVVKFGRAYLAWMAIVVIRLGFLCDSRVCEEGNRCGGGQGQFYNSNSKHCDYIDVGWLCQSSRDGKVQNAI